MRVTHHGLVSQVISNVEYRLNKIAKSQEQVTTGLRVNHPSDDPVAAGELLRLHSRLDRLQQYQRNIESGLANMRMTDTVLSNIRDLVIRARSSAVEGANGALAEQDRQAIAEQIDQCLRELLSLANQKSGNRYLFGGTDTLSRPYRGIEDDNGGLENISSNFGESQNAVEMVVNEGERMEMSIGATDTFNFGDGETLFNILFDLRQALLDNDEDETGRAIPRLDDALDNLSAVSSMLGSRINSANSLISRFEDNEIDMSERISELGDIDIVEAVTRLNEDQTSYELALRISAKTIQPSLVNFVYL